MSSAVVLPSGWISSPLGEVFSVLGGGTPSTADPEFWDGEIPWLTSADISDRHEMRVRRTVTEEGVEKSAANKVPPGSVIVVTRVGLGKVAVAETELCFSQDCQALIPEREAIDPHFAMYQLSRTARSFQAVSRGTTISGITKKQLLDTTFLLAPIEEQRRIVAEIEELLSDLDAGAGALERVKANLARYKASVLKAAVDGGLTETWREEHPNVEPARALLARMLVEGRERREAERLAKYEAKGQRLAEGWRGKYEEPEQPAGLSDLPSGWCWATVSQLLEESMCAGISIRGSEDPPGVPSVRLSAMSVNGFDFSDCKYLPLDSDVARKLAIHEGDFFVSRGNGSIHLVGRGTLAQQPGGEVVFPDLMIRLRLPAMGSLRSFVSLVWESRLIRRQVENRARTTAGIYKISQTDVGQFLIPLPPLEEQSEIVRLVQSSLSIAQAVGDRVEGNLRRARRLHQSILSRAFSGKLVPQDPSDEHASVLLERIRADRAAREAAAPTRRPRGSKKSLPSDQLGMAGNPIKVQHLVSRPLDIPDSE